MAEANQKTYRVSGMTCGHCELSVKEQIEEIAGLEVVEVDRERGQVTVRGEAIDDAAVRTAVTEAGYEVAA